MGQTLSHGVYLPAEGERNCYSGLASNWNLLDTAIGDTAGKASASHTHGNITNDGKVGTTANLPLITGTGGAVQAGSFGNQANTFCEGNDSRLSDARTPVAHTHGNITNDGKLATANRVLITDGNKVISLSGVTDTELSYLSGVTSAIQTQLNAKAADSDVVHKTGNESIGGEKTFTSIPSFKYHSANAYNDLRFYDYEGNYIATIRQTNSSFILGQKRSANWADGSQILLNSTGYLSFKMQDADNTSYIDVRTTDIKPTNSTIHLGVATNRWKSVYSDSYYYGTTAWGLDKANTWTGTNTFTAATYGNKVVLKNTGLDLSNGNSGLTDTYLHFIQWVDNSDTVYAMLQGFTKSANTTTVISNKYKTDANTSVTAELRLENSGTAKSFYANSNGDTDLGTSAKKWKTLNGINPGALSLPSSHYVEIGTDGWDLTGATYNRVYINNANPTFPGILYMRINSTTATDILVRLFTTSGQEISYVGSKMEAGSNNMIVTVPCPPSTNIYVQINTSSSISTCRYYTLLGDPEFDSRSGN